MRILFVSGIDGFCLRYQVLHRAAQVAELGGHAKVRHFADPRLAAEAAASDVVWLYRVPDTAWIRSVVSGARAAGRAIVGSIDDLVFDPDATLFPGVADWPADGRELWFDGVRRYGATLRRCDRVVVPTAALCEEARAAGLPAVVHGNSASGGELALGAAARRRREEAGCREAPRGPVVIGYPSGTPTHDGDFALAAPALGELLCSRRDVRLRLIGPVDPGPRLAGLGDRVERRELVPWWRLPDELAACDVCIAPLRLDRFGAAKGEVKYLEAAAVSRPLVASPSGAFREAIRAGETGMLAATLDDWRGALATLTSDLALRQRMGAAARADVERRFSDAVRARELAAILYDAVAAARSRTATPPSPPTPCAPEREPRLARFALEADGFPGVVPAAEPVAESPPLVAGHVVAQRLRAACDGLARVDVRAVTYGLPVHGALELECAEMGAGGRREVVAAARVPGTEIPDRGWLALEMDAPLASAGREYEVTVRLVSDDPRAGLCLGVAPAPPAGEPARLDGEPLAGQRLALRGFAAWRTAAPGASAGAPGAAEDAAPR